MLWAKLSAMSCSLWLGRLLGLQPRGRNGKGQLPLQSGPTSELASFPEPQVLGAAPWSVAHNAVDCLML